MAHSRFIPGDLRNAVQNVVYGCSSGLIVLYHRMDNQAPTARYVINLGVSTRMPGCGG